jgi:hypothetical protein
MEKCLSTYHFSFSRSSACIASVCSLVHFVPSTYFRWPMFSDLKNICPSLGVRDTFRKVTKPRTKHCTWLNVLVNSKSENVRHIRNSYKLVYKNVKLKVFFFFFFFFFLFFLMPFSGVGFFFFTYGSFQTFGRTPWVGDQSSAKASTYTR